MLRLFSIVLFLLFAFSPLRAQLEKTIHKTFPVDDASQISLNIKGDCELVLWKGDHVLTETSIRLYDASEGIFEHFLERGRYEILADTTSSVLKLESQDQERTPIRTKKGECFESVNVRVFIPDVFEINSETSCTRKTTVERSPEKG